MSVPRQRLKPPRQQEGAGDQAKEAIGVENSHKNHDPGRHQGHGDDDGIPAQSVEGELAHAKFCSAEHIGVSLFGFADPGMPSEGGQKEDPV